MNKKLLALIVVGGIGLSFPAQADQTGNCTQGTEYCESVDTTTTTTSTGTNTNTTLIRTRIRILRRTLILRRIRTRIQTPMLIRM